ncbi:MAG: amino acid permease, partial [Acidobacteria bacterium]|nr:amino acid permease [Acidobacteriota bacterium]
MPVPPPVTQISAVQPLWAIEGGRVAIAGADFRLDGPLPDVRVGPHAARVVHASSRSLGVLVPSGLEGGRTAVRIGGLAGETAYIDVGAPIATGLHQVDNPVFDTRGNLYVTYSGTRGQPAPVSIFRVRRDGLREPFVSAILNPTSLAIDRLGHLFVSSRFEGTVYRVDAAGHVDTFATDLGVACGLAFGPDDALYVGDRSGSLFRVTPASAHMHQLFRRKPIAELVIEGSDPRALKRVMGAGDLVMLAIGAVIGAGIFGAIGTAAAGQLDAAGNVVRSGAGPALIFSFLLLGGACALAGLCYAELASMIPQAGSAYAYSYATLGELVAWIIGWDLILEYAVGNVAVAISWGDYFTTLLGGFGISLPVWLTTGYRTALLSADAEVHGLLQTAPRIAGLPILVNVPAFAIVMAITWVLLRGAKESARVNNVMVVIKLLALGLFIAVGATHIDAANYRPFAPNGFTGIHQGAAIVFFAYIGFDAISTAAEETINPQRNLPIGILGGLAICTFIYVVVGAVLTGMVPYTELAVADPLAHA